MAEVFLAASEGSAGFVKPVAIKRMRRELTSNKEFVDLFVEEARTAARLSHANVCQVYELTNAGGQYHMVMEYLEGVPVSRVVVELMRDPEAFELSFVLGIIEQACDGIQYVHEQTDKHGESLNLVHRDVSPPNLFVTVNGVLKILDFGIAKSKTSLVKTLTGQIRGKFAYMSPEQLRGSDLDGRSDVFSLGIVLFELATGQRLFRRKSRLNVFQAIVKDPIPLAKEYRRTLSDDIVAVISRALQRDREQRFQSARDLGIALRNAAPSVGGVLGTEEIGRAIRSHFADEIAEKRELLRHLTDERSSSNFDTSPSVSAPEHTIPDADSQFIDTGASTMPTTSIETTAVDLEPAPSHSGSTDTKK